MKVLGIDPGTMNLGWGYIDWEGGALQVQHGCFKVSSKTNFYQRLYHLGKKFSELVEEVQPDVVAIEQIFLGKNVDSAFKLGHIRGICAARCQEAGASVVEYGARTVKKQITGSGNAEKAVVQSFLLQQLKLATAPETLDASDALALAFCHILQDSVRRKQQRGMGI